MNTGDILGVHHIKIPVTDLGTSRAWYERIFELEPLREFRDDHDGVVRGVTYFAKGDLCLALRENPEVARNLAGFDFFAMMLHGRADIDYWANRLDELGVAHDDIITAPIGFIMAFHDPDGIELRFYTLNEHGLDPEGRARA